MFQDFFKLWLHTCAHFILLQRKLQVFFWLLSVEEPMVDSWNLSVWFLMTWRKNPLQKCTKKLVLKRKCPLLYGYSVVFVYCGYIHTYVCNCFTKWHYVNANLYSFRFRALYINYIDSIKMRPLLLFTLLLYTGLTEQVCAVLCSEKQILKNAKRKFLKRLLLEDGSLRIVQVRKTGK